MSAPHHTLPPGAHLKLVLLLAATAAAAIACWLGGVSLSVYTLLGSIAGLTLLLAPPSHRPPLSVMVAALLCFGGMTFALLPVESLSPVPDWRAIAIGEWKLPLSTTLAPQVERTLGALLLTAIMAGFVASICGHDLPVIHRRYLLRTLTVLIVLTTAVGLAQRLGLIHIPWPQGITVKTGLDFGPFPNRNHFSGLAAMGCILCAACAYDAYRKRSVLWLLFAMAVLIPFTVIVVNTSRSGLILFFVGSAVWINSAAMRRGFFRRLATSASLTLGIAAVLMVFGGGAGEKLAHSGVIDSLRGESGRLDIYQEAFSLALQAPWTGVGLGNFDGVFPLNHHLKNAWARFIHPESDWLWLWCEAGFLSVIGAALLALCTLRACGPWLMSKEDDRSLRQDRRLRNACGIAIAMAFAQSLVDVPLHNAAFLATVAVLASIGVSPLRRWHPAGKIYQTSLRLLGLTLLSLATWLGAFGSAAGKSEPPFPGRFHLQTLKRQASHAIERSAYSQALSLLDDAIQRFPLQWDLYFQRATVHLSLRHPSDRALMDFGRARYLEPNNFQICQEEAQWWLRHDPPLALNAWRETLRRRPDPGLFAQMLNATTEHPRLRQSLWTLANTPAEKLHYLELPLPPDQWQLALQALLTQSPTLDALAPDEKTRLFRHWYAKGDPNHLLSELTAHPEWQQDAWQLMADHYARESEFKRAWELQQQFGLMPTPDPSSSLSDVDTLERNFVYNPTDVRRGVDLFYAQKAAGNLDNALVTLEKIKQLPDFPPYLKQEEASLYAAKNDFRRAYELMKAATTR